MNFLSRITKIFLSLSLLIGILFPLFSSPVSSASLTALSDTLSRQDDDIDANHTIQFDLVSTWDATETVVVDFVDADGWDTSGFANSDDNDFDISWEGANKEVVVNGACAADKIEITTVNTTTDTFTFTLCSGSTASAATDTIVIKIGTHANQEGTGDTQINNATDAGSKIITITGPGGDSGSLAVPILSSDQVQVSATVDPSITSALDSTTCTMTTAITISSTGFCTYKNTVNTNATGGYAATIISSDTTGRLCSPSPGTCTNNIPVEGGNNVVTQGGSEYGVGTDRSGQTISEYTTCANNNNQPATALSDTVAKQYANATGPVSTHETNLCHAATVSGSQAAGSYSHSVTHVTTGNF